MKSLIIKTRAPMVQKLMLQIKESHYQTPSIHFMPLPTIT